MSPSPVQTCHGNGNGKRVNCFCFCSPTFRRARSALNAAWAAGGLCVACVWRGVACVWRVCGVCETCVWRAEMDLDRAPKARWWVCATRPCIKLHSVLFIVQLIESFRHYQVAASARWCVCATRLWIKSHSVVRIVPLIKSSSHYQVAAWSCTRRRLR